MRSAADDYPELARGRGVQARAALAEIDQLRAEVHRLRRRGEVLTYRATRTEPGRWAIDHGLHDPTPLVTLYDALGRECTLGCRIEWTDANTITVEGDQAFVAVVQA